MTHVSASIVQEMSKEFNIDDLLKEEQGVLEGNGELMFELQFIMLLSSKSQPWLVSICSVCKINFILILWFSIKKVIRNKKS